MATWLYQSMYAPRIGAVSTALVPPGSTVRRISVLNTTNRVRRHWRQGLALVQPRDSTAKSTPKGLLFRTSC
eukprot:3707900-Rhodomonas_salina.1